MVGARGSASSSSRPLSDHGLRAGRAPRGGARARLRLRHEPGLDTRPARQRLESVVALAVTTQVSRYGCFCNFGCTRFCCATVCWCFLYFVVYFWMFWLLKLALRAFSGLRGAGKAGRRRGGARAARRDRLDRGLRRGDALLVLEERAAGPGQRGGCAQPRSGAAPPSAPRFSEWPLALVSLGRYPHGLWSLSSVHFLSSCVSRSGLWEHVVGALGADSELQQWHAEEVPRPTLAPSMAGEDRAATWSSQPRDTLQKSDCSRGGNRVVRCVHPLISWPKSVAGIWNPDKVKRGAERKEYQVYYCTECCALDMLAPSLERGPRGSRALLRGTGRAPSALRACFCSIFCLYTMKIGFMLSLGLYATQCGRSPQPFFYWPGASHLGHRPPKS